MSGKSSNIFSSMSSKTATKRTADETRDSSSTYSYDPKQDSARTQQKDNEDKIKKLQQTAYKNSIRMGL